jgi:chorismate mutase/prephenate dehydratase
MEIVSKIALYKIENDMEVFDRSREDLLLKKTAKELTNPELKGDLNLFFTNLMDISKSYQRRKIESTIPDRHDKEKSLTKVAFQGIPGSFSYSAMKGYFGKMVKGNNFETFEEVFDAVEKGEVDYGVLPFDNSSTGTIKDNYDLIRERDVYIVGEINIKAKQNLLAKPATKLEDIKEIYSHPQGFAQSSIYLKDKGYKCIPYKNTALSAEYVANSSENIGAIASLEAAELYGLKVLKENINDSDKNHTRFIIIGKEIEVEENANKVSIVFSTLHKAGELFGTISTLAKRDINMVSIKSIPILEKPWEYFFYIDINGNLEDEIIREALKEIEGKSHFFKLLGNYREGN